MKDGYSIDRDGKRKVLTGNYVSCYYQNLVKLVLPKGCKDVWCYDNHLTELVIPKGCKNVWCFNNHLVELVIPEGCEWVTCDYIPNVITPEGCRVDMELNITL